MTYRLTKTSSTNWRGQVFASGGAETVHFFDGTVSVAANDCTAAATANNGLACNLCGAAKAGGNGGTFALTPGVAASTTACGSCAALVPFTPSTISVTTSTISTCTGTCECSNRWKLTGTTTPNRTITLNQVSACVWEATVAADYLLFDHDTAAATFNIDTIRHELVRIGATSATWEIAGYDGAIKRITYASGTSAVTANDCKTWPTVTHTSPGFSVSNTTDTGVFGSAGSTSLSSCP